jgi:SNF2 family DNA or RNA helicase
VRTFDFSKKIKKIYDDLKKNFIVSLEDKPLFGFQYVLQQSIYMRKLCSGFVTLDPETKETKLIDLSKYKLLMDVVNIEIPDYKCIILCNFYDEIYTIEKFFKQSKKKFSILTGKTKSLDRGKIISDFQNDKIQYVIANVGCMKHGVTLSNADVTIEFGSILGAETVEQGEIRGTDIYRDDKQSIIHLVAKGSVEEYFYKKIGIQESKKKFREDFLKYLRKD